MINGRAYQMAVMCSDHFFLGGPLNIRGFDSRGVGPHQEGEPSHLLFSLKVLFRGLFFFLPLLKNDFFST
jgi:outer membrane protein assembly factor BamA